MTISHTQAHIRNLADRRRFHQLVLLSMLLIDRDTVCTLRLLTRLLQILNQTWAGILFSVLQTKSNSVFIISKIECEIPIDNSGFYCLFVKSNCYPIFIIFSSLWSLYAACDLLDNTSWNRVPSSNPSAVFWDMWIRVLSKSFILCRFRIFTWLVPPLIYRGLSVWFAYIGVFPRASPNLFVFSLSGRQRVWYGTQNSPKGRLGAGESLWKPRKHCELKRVPGFYA